MSKRMIWVVSLHNTILGLYTCAPDANTYMRALEQRGVRGATCASARMNTETEAGAALIEGRA